MSHIPQVPEPMLFSDTIQSWGEFLSGLRNTGLGRIHFLFACASSLNTSSLSRPATQAGELRVPDFFHVPEFLCHHHQVPFIWTLRTFSHPLCLPALGPSLFSSTQDSSPSHLLITQIWLLPFNNSVASHPLLNKDSILPKKQSSIFRRSDMVFLAYTCNPTCQLHHPMSPRLAFCTASSRWPSQTPWSLAMPTVLHMCLLGRNPSANPNSLRASSRLPTPAPPTHT